MPVGGREDAQAGRGQHRLYELPGLPRLPWSSEHSRVRADAEELIEDPPSEEPWGSLIPPLLEQRAATIVEGGVLVGSVDQDVRVDHEQSATFHGLIEGLAIGDVDEMSPASKSRQSGQRLFPFGRLKQ